jgi:succinyl-diaminopimelate desuccinylase
MLDYIDYLKDEIIEKTQELIRIPSVYSNSNDPLKPFGENANKALEYILDLGKKLGFRTKNLDGYCGYIEFGEGEELIGIVGHLDVVPEGEGWTFPPFSATISDNKIFGRGAVDDKGPVISSLYAMKAVMENCKIHKRVRLILGLNEEKDWKCIKHYKEIEEIPNFGFSPDADFPCIYAEKSILNCSLSMKYENSNPFSTIQIKEIDCKNNALNVVPKFCSTIITIDESKIKMQDFIENIKELITKNNFEIDVYKMGEQQLKLTSHGVQAHGAHPDLGINAISRLIVILSQIFKQYNASNELFDFFNRYIGTEYDGKSLGIHVEDESGKLTLNVGHLSLKDSRLEMGMNIRIPIHTSVDFVKENFLKYCNLYPNLNFCDKHHTPALYIPKDNILITTLCKIFHEVTNLDADPIAIGGATYARAFKNCVSFGANLPGHKDMCHQTDEFIDIDNLILSCKIYAKAIVELGSKNFKIQ